MIPRTPLADFVPRIRLDKKEIRKRLSAQAYKTTQEGWIDKANAGIYTDFSEFGTYRCVVCDEEKFKSQDKIVSFGWATFVDGTGVTEVDMVLPKRTFVSAFCENCGSIMGEVKDEHPNGKKEKSFWINSTALKFFDNDGVPHNEERKFNLPDRIRIFFGH